MKIFTSSNPRGGLALYLGMDNAGPEYRRHDALCRPGLWTVSFTGWSAVMHAVVDDFGTLVEVQP